MSSRRRMLIVEDDTQQLAQYLGYAKMLDLDVVGLRSFEEAKDYLAAKGVDILLTDIHLTQTINQNTFEGIALIKFVTETYPEIQILAMSSDPKVETYRSVLKIGAVVFLKKPIVAESEIALAIENVRNISLLKNAATHSTALSTEVSGELAKSCPDGVVFDERLRKVADKLATNRKISILIYGETGTGKEEFTKLIHRSRCKIEGPTPFVAINCANLDQNLAASILFGHVRGAFTGADKTSNGYVGEADGGILFLDEIHALSIEMQRRLLRVISDGTYNRVGDTRVLRSEFQLVCASNKNLEAEVKEGRFIIDLLMRITGFNISLPPLRERQQDIAAFVSLFLSRERVEVEHSEFNRIVEKCSQYYWQGNVRQLQKAISAMVMNASLDDIPVRAELLPVMDTMLPPSMDPVLPNSNRDDRSIQRVLGPQGIPADIADTLLKPLTEDADFSKTIETYERAVIGAALGRHRKYGEVAKALNMARSTFDDRRRRYGI